MAGPLDPLLEQWIDRFRGPLTGLLASWGADWREAEEMAQDTFAEAWLSRARLRGSPTDSRVIGPWLRGIAGNLHRSKRRRMLRRRHQELAEPDAIPAPDANPETDDRLDALRSAFAKLRPAQQTVLRMFYLDGSSTREVAALLQLSEKAVEGRLYQARRALRAQTERIRAQAAGESQ